MDDQFGLLLITGNQTHQENYARAFAEDVRCRLVGLADEDDVPQRRRELNQDLADELGIEYLPNLEEAIRRDDVDFVSICAEPERRESITIACAQAGKAVYLDKDPAPTVAAAHGIQSAIQEAGVLSQAFSLVRSPAATRAKAILDSGDLGELIGMHADITFAKGIAGTADLAKPRIEKSNPTRFTFVDSKREFLCTGYYALILFQWLTGKRFVEVDATTSNYFFEEHQKNDVEDFSFVMASMEEGIETTITAGRCGWSSHPGFGVYDVRLVGTKQTVTIDSFAPRVQLFDDGPQWKQPETPHPEDPMGFWSSTQKAGGVKPKTVWHAIGSAGKSDFSVFLDCLEFSKPSDVPIELATHTVDVVHAAYASAEVGSTVRIAKPQLD